MTLNWDTRPNTSSTKTRTRAHHAGPRHSPTHPGGRPRSHSTGGKAWSKGLLAGCGQVTARTEDPLGDHPVGAPRAACFRWIRVWASRGGPGSIIEWRSTGRPLTLLRRRRSCRRSSRCWLGFSAWTSGSGSRTSAISLGCRCGRSPHGWAGQGVTGRLWTDDGPNGRSARRSPGWGRTSETGARPQVFERAAVSQRSISEGGPDLA